MWWVWSLSGQLIESTSASRNSSSRPDQVHAELLRELGVGVGVVGDEPHAEGLRQPEHLGADVADAELAEGAVDQADAHVIDPPGPALGTAPRDPVLGDELPGRARA